MSFGPIIIQQPTTLNFRPFVGEVDNAALELRTSEIQLINREARIAREEREADGISRVKECPFMGNCRVRCAISYEQDPAPWNQYVCECGECNPAPQSRRDTNR